MTTRKLTHKPRQPVQDTLTMKAFEIDVIGFDSEPVSIVAAKSRGQARMVVASSLHEFWSKDMGKCLKQIKSVKRSPEHDHFIDQNNTRPRYINKWTN